MNVVHATKLTTHFVVIQIINEFDFEVLCKLQRDFPLARILILADSSVALKLWTQNIRHDALLPDDCSPDELLHAIWRLQEGYFYQSPKLAFAVVPSSLPSTYLYKKLSEREREVFALLSEGFPNEEISDKLYISKSTIKIHKQNIMKKLDIPNQRELLLLAGSYRTAWRHHLETEMPSSSDSPKD